MFLFGLWGNGAYACTTRMTSLCYDHALYTYLCVQTLLNKAALSSFDFKAPDSLLFFQCFLCVVLVKVFAMLGYIKVEPFNWNIVRVWYPVNLIFVGMIITSFWALKDLGVATVTVLKNMTNLIVVSAEYFLYGRVYNMGIWATMGLMVLSAVVGGFTDLAFSASGYFWQMVNSGFTAANMLYLKYVYTGVHLMLYDANLYYYVMQSCDGKGEEIHVERRTFG